MKVIRISQYDYETLFNNIISVSITRFGIIKIEGVKVIRNFTIDFENIAMILWLLIIPNVLDESISKYLKNDNIYNI
ncbi:hypothetical protein BU080_03860 [Staphylococcus warneri]|nr:hypothetical protein BU083_10550 [Staphylococcus warneri]PTI16849.1 hypothetical protein BU084_09390 [Staphylococcus warneri]PTI25480.1 hypothetical protein BU080_03860 [Staphylococcus warneri]RIN11638.1 hypothetical protein BU086_08970 [Staphylococcus warneri]